MDSRECNISALPPEPRTCETCGKSFPECKCLIPTIDTDPPCHAWTPRSPQSADVETVRAKLIEHAEQQSIGGVYNRSDEDALATLDRIAGKEEK